MFFRDFVSLSSLDDEVPNNDDIVWSPSPRPYLFVIYIVVNINVKNTVNITNITVL